MAIFSSAHLALCRSLAAVPRAASLGESLWQASDGYFTRRLLHGQLLPRCFASDAFGPNKNSLPSGPAELKPHQNFSDFNYVRQDLRSKAQFNFNNADNGGTTFKTAGGEKPLNLGGRNPFASHASGNKKTGASAGCLEDRKGRSRLSRYAAEATAEHVGRSARKMGLRSVVMKVKGAAFFKKKKKVILGFREGFRGERVRDQSPIMYIHDVTQLPHNGCRLPKQRRV
ncbi:unnamed protein product [Urochloa humidicola]